MWLWQRLRLQTGHFRLTSYLNKAARKWYVTETMARNGSSPRNMKRNWPVIHSFFGGINSKRRPLKSLFATCTITSFHKALFHKHTWQLCMKSHFSIGCFCDKPVMTTVYSLRTCHSLEIKTLLFFETSRNIKLPTTQRSISNEDNS